MISLSNVFVRRHTFHECKKNKDILLDEKIWPEKGLKARQNWFFNYSPPGPFLVRTANYLAHVQTKFPPVG